MTDTTKRLDEAIDVFKESIVQHVLTLNAGEHTVIDKAVIKRDAVKTILAALNFAKAMQPSQINEETAENTDMIWFNRDGEFGQRQGWLVRKNGCNRFLDEDKEYLLIPDQALKELEEALND